MLDITVVILTKNEEKNIEASIASAKRIAKRIVVVDSGSEDETVKIAESLGAEVCFHEWENYAKQFNWALDNCDIKTEWVFRLDADERITEKLAKEITDIFTNNLQVGVDGYKMRLNMYFMNKQLKHGGSNKLYFLRLFRNGVGRVENTNMDEHVVINGKVQKLKSRFVHYDYKGLDEWLKKHIWYSGREVLMYREKEYEALSDGSQKRKRGFYYRLPLFLRAKFYYIYRYYLQLGFLDGKEGKIFCFLQAYWYRFLVDAKIYEAKKERKK